MSAKKDDVYSKLALIQKNLKISKARFNAFGKYNYRNTEDILLAVKKHLDGCILVMNDSIVSVDERIYLAATVTITFNGQSVSTTAYAREPLSKKGMDESQITGAASSYARKYALSGMFAIDDEQDADNLSEADYDEQRVVLDNIKKCKTEKELKSVYDNLKSSADKERYKAAITARKEEIAGNEYPKEGFDKNFPSWKKAILAGKKSPEDIINTISSSYTLSDEQLKAIKSVGVDNE